MTFYSLIFPLCLRLVFSQTLTTILDNTAGLTVSPTSATTGGLCLNGRFGIAFTTGSTAYNITRVDTSIYSTISSTTAIKVLVEIWTSTGGGGGTSVSASPIDSAVAIGTGMLNGATGFMSLALTSPLYLPSNGQFAVTISPQTLCSGLTYTLWRSTNSFTAASGVAFVASVTSTTGQLNSWTASTFQPRGCMRLLGTTVVSSPGAVWLDSTANLTAPIPTATALALGSNAAAWGFTAPAASSTGMFGLSSAAFALGTTGGSALPVTLSLSLVTSGDQSSTGTQGPVGAVVASTSVSVTLLVSAFQH